MAGATPGSSCSPAAGLPSRNGPTRKRASPWCWHGQSRRGSRLRLLPHAAHGEAYLFPHQLRPPGRDVIRRPPALVHLRLLDEAEGAAVPGIFGGRPAIAEAAALGVADQQAALLVPAGV